MTPAERLILDAARARVLLLATDSGLEAKPYGADTLPPDLSNRLKAHRDDVLELLRQKENPYRRDAVEGGACQSVLDSLGDLYDRCPEDAAEHRAIWEEQTDRDVFGGDCDFSTAKTYKVLGPFRAGGLCMGWGSVEAQDKLDRFEVSPHNFWIF